MLELHKADVSRRTEEPDRIEGVGLNDTIAFPIDPWFQLGDPRLVLAALFGILALALPRGRTRG